ncbi:MAG: PKD domain-containing protein, partial [Flavobacteriales bacterium]
MKQLGPTIHKAIGRTLRPTITLALLFTCALAFSQVSQTFTSNGTFTVPAGVTQVTVECWGGGGQGSTRSTNGRGGGGGGGAYARSVLTVSSGNYTVTVGSGSNSTSPGGDSWFSTSTTILAKGGSSAANNSENGATGGSAAASIGTVKFAGGDGADAPGSSGGGGGSSAGTAANGVDATNVNGANAPTGGGDGGDGRNGNGTGFNGSAPGGGGGGAERTSGGSKSGGDGGDGQVIVSYNYPNGLCMTANAGNALPDNGCGSSNNVVIPIAISGLPTVLGTNPGNARLQSVEVIVSHTYNRDIHISLTAPGAVTRDLILDRFGSGDNLGDPTTCPAAPMIFADGGAALSTTNTNNATGPYAPEQTLAGFTGNPNGNWVFTICDNEAADFGNVLYLKLNFCTVPEITASSSNSPICAGSPLNLSVTATGTAPLTYAWTGTGSYSPNAASTTPVVTGAASGNYNIAVTNGCGSTNTNVAVTVTTPPSATISYSGSPYCQGAGTVSVTHTGTAGGSYGSSPAGLSINPISGAVTLSTSVVGSYTVTYTVAAAGGCPLFSTTAGITINATPIYYQDLDSDDFGDPAVSTASCTPVGGYVLNNTDNCPALFGLIGDACDDSDANTINDQIDGTCTCAGTNTPWYSQASGTIADPIWSHNPGGPGGPATFNRGSVVHIQTGHTITNTSALTVDDLTVGAGATMSLGSNPIDIHGSSIVVDGALDGGTANISILSATAATLSGSGTLDVYDMTVNTPAGFTCSADMPIRGTLTLEDGVFTATGVVSLVSNASGTGSLGEVSPTASYVGNLTVNRYIPGGATNWRMLGSAVSGQTVNNWKDDFFTAGFPGSDYPNFYSPANSTNYWPSVREYDETNTGVANDGLDGVANNTVALTAGKGFAAWCGDNLSTTAAFTVDVTGPPNIASSPIDLPVTYTVGGGVAEDGWNMVSNPLPSAIDFSAVTLGANTFNGYYVYSPIDGSTEVWDESLGTSSGSFLNGDIASSQGFWLKATAASPTNSSVDETAKVPGNGGGLFGGADEPTMPIIRLNMSSGMNTYQDNALVVFNVGVPEFEPIDAPKMFFSDASAPFIASLASTGERLAISKYGSITEDISIPVEVRTGVAGTYTISAEISGQPLACLWLEDTQTGTMTPLVDGATYSFELATSADPEERFIIHSAGEVPFTSEAGTCGANGTAMVDLGNAVADVTWSTSGGTVVLAQPDATGEVIFSTDVADNYFVTISTDAVCGTISLDFDIDIDETAVVAAFEAPASAFVNETLAFTNNSTDYGTFVWNFGDNTTSTEANPEHSYMLPGTFTVTLEVTADDCTIITTSDVVVSANTGIADLSAEDVNVWASEQGINVEHTFNKGKVIVDVLDASGRKH